MLKEYKAMVVQLTVGCREFQISTKAALQARTPEGRAEDKPTEGAPLSYAGAMSGGGKKPPQPILLLPERNPDLLTINLALFCTE